MPKNALLFGRRQCMSLVRLNSVTFWRLHLSRFWVCVYLSWAVPGLCCSHGFPVVVSDGSSLLGVRGLLVAGTSCYGAQALGHAGFGGSSTWAQQWRFPGL